jgi:hypothetical protein
MLGTGPLGSGFDADFSSGADGSFIWRGEDLDACLQNPDFIFWDNIDITGRTGLVFSGRFAARDTQPFETTDAIRVSYRIDSDVGAYTVALVFTPDLSGDLAESVSGTKLTTALTNFTFAIPVTGTTLDILLEADINGGSEEFALDLFEIGDNNMVPVELQGFDIE